MCFDFLRETTGDLDLTFLDQEEKLYDLTLDVSGFSMTCAWGSCGFCRGTEETQVEEGPGGAEESVAPKGNLEIKEPQESL